MTNRWLVLLLRVEAAVLFCALPAVFFPADAMAAMHAGLGLGDMPRGPLVEYLTRSLSLLYALLGPVLLVLSSDVRRYRPLLRVLGWTHLVGAIALSLIGIWSGMPLWWILVEGPMVLGLGIVILVFTPSREEPS